MSKTWIPIFKMQFLQETKRLLNTNCEEITLPTAPWSAFCSPSVFFPELLCFGPPILCSAASALLMFSSLDLIKNIY